MSKGKMSENNFMVKNCASLPVEVLKNIIAYKLGEPEYLKIKHNHDKTLKRIQQRYKINRTETKRKTKRYTVVGGDDIKRHVIEYYISRNIPLNIKSIKDIVFNEQENLDCLLDGIVDDEGYEVTLIVEASLFVRFHHFNCYEDDEFSTFTFHVHSDSFVYNVNQDNIADVMRAA
ncbi:MAG: hypothetical protein NXI08_17245, partial [bacterium]|nr:hypothetical protein [bacterium]